MELINQHTKAIMEGCKERALDAGLRFDKESLEYIVTNMDMLELTPKNMIPTLYDYWLQEIQVLRGKGEYELYPQNPYETVINTRPVISFYNDNNPDWLNVMIFYHVLGHIDFFQNNKFFQKTWDYDFKEKALTEKRIIAKLRSQKGRAVDYVIEFAKGIDNLVGYYEDLNSSEDSSFLNLSPKAEYYFNVFLQEEKKVGMKFFLEEINRFNSSMEKNGDNFEDVFFNSVTVKNPEFEEFYKKHKKSKINHKAEDLLQFILQESSFLKKEENLWMKTVIEIIRDSALYFSPQIRTKIMNEGWASYWHERLFLNDDRINGNEVAFARVNAKVTALSKVGLNPYAVGWRLFMHVEDMANKGKYSYEYNLVEDIQKRKQFNKKLSEGREFIFHIRENYNDATFINTFVDQEFVDRFKLMVVGQRINRDKMVKEYYVKSRKAADYKQMILSGLFHPPIVAFKKDKYGTLRIKHKFEQKELYREYIQNTIIGIEYLWGGKVQLETTEIDWEKIKKIKEKNGNGVDLSKPENLPTQKVRYICKDKKVTKQKFN